MRFLLDESMEYRLATWLQSQGHDATAIAYDYPHALPDVEVLALAHREERILLTNDRDYGDLVFRWRRPHVGVIYFRFPPASVDAKIVTLSQLLVTHHDQLDQFIVVTPRSVRIRRTRQQ